MDIEENRLYSFSEWPETAGPVNAAELAQAGFYYSGENQQLICFGCGIVIRDLTQIDQVMARHREFQPRCSFVNGSTSVDTTLSQGKDAVEKNDDDIMSGTAEQLDQLGIQSHTKPIEPICATYECRLKTFKGWPTNLKQTPESLAAAGFYYIGFDDYVRCFHCDGGLVNWETNDDPWIEHARWFPKCKFVGMVQGQKFIKMCIENKPPVGHPIIADHYIESCSSKLSSPSTSSAEPSTSQVNIFSNSNMGKGIRLVPAMIVNCLSQAKLNSPSTSSAEPSTSKSRLVTDLQIYKKNPSLSALQAIKKDLYSDIAEDILRKRFQTCQIQDNQNRLADAEKEFLEAMAPELASTLNLINSEQLSKCSQQTISNGIEESVENRNEVPESSQETASTALLNEEIRKLKEARLCKICMDREVSIVFLPCGHLVTCMYCVPCLTHCPICRENIRATVRTFLA